MKITFFGAAGEVTGSQHLLETDEHRVLLDCGLFQGRRYEARQKNERFRCQPRHLHGVILSHAHIDHSGNLPGLFKAGFRGPVFCTEATADVAHIMLRDSAKIQQEDARYLRRRLAPGHPDVEPLYDEHDVRGVVRNFETLPYNEWHELDDGFRLRFTDAGHILGSAITELEVRDGDFAKRIVFTGDLGRRGLPILRDPTPVEGCDVLITESTYGNQVHPPVGDLKESLLEIIRAAAERGGRVIIPVFSLGRTQNIIYFLNHLHNEGRLPRIPVFVDSPLATRLTDVYERYAEIMDEAAQVELRRDHNLFEFEGLSYVRTQQESIALNRRRGPFVVISASGMCENGRIVHHLKHAVEDPRNTIVIIGYQAAHTLGRRIFQRQPKLRIFDRYYDLKARVEIVNGLSAHGDVTDLKWWFDQLAARGGIGQAFVVHGEPESAGALATVLRDYSDEPPIVPQLYQWYEV